MQPLEKSYERKLFTWQFQAQLSVSQKYKFQFQPLPGLF